MYEVKENIDEENLIEKCKDDINFFEPIYRKYYESIFRYVFQRVDDKEIAFDITHQVFIKAITKIGQYTYRGISIASWLYRIASNELMDYFRKNSKHRTVNFESTGLSNLIVESELDNTEERINLVMKEIALLEEDDLNLIELRFFEKRSFKDIAEITGLSESNAKIRVYRILQKIKKQISHKIETL